MAREVVRRQASAPAQDEVTELSGFSTQAKPRRSAPVGLSSRFLATFRDNVLIIDATVGLVDIIDERKVEYLGDHSGHWALNRWVVDLFAARGGSWRVWQQADLSGGVLITAEDLLRLAPLIDSGDLVKVWDKPYFNPEVGKAEVLNTIIKCRAALDQESLVIYYGAW